MLIPSPQSFADDRSLLSVHSVKHQGGRTLLTVSVPEEIFPMVRNMLENGVSLVRWVETQNRTQKAIERAHDPVEQEKRDAQFGKYTEGILKVFDTFVASGLSAREAIRNTKEHFKKKGRDDLTCYTIELMVNERKRLRRKK